MVVEGIMLQLPMPKHISEGKILSEISLDKDVDGFHPTHIGKLAMKGIDPLFVPCTPKVVPYMYSHAITQPLYMHRQVILTSCESMCS